ncbi:hypothetical protein QTN94_13080 [Vibrio sp. M250220]|uniref:hypothetical protein n=1 Tax=Vibrio sp. M250220 TaxID=3020894 RepID=UPI002F3EF52D
MSIDSIVDNDVASIHTDIGKIESDKLDDNVLLITRVNKEQREKIKSLTRDIEILKEKLQSDKKEIGFEVWLGLTLASVTLIVTGLGVVIALLAFFGYSNIKREATKAAVKKSELLVLKAIKEDQFNEVIYSAVERAVYRGILSDEDFPEEEELSL